VRLLLEIALVVAAAVAAMASVASVPSVPFARRRRRPEREPSHPGQLVTLERLVMMAGTSALQVHAYLRPLLAEVAEQHLAARGQSLERMTDETGRRLLGEKLWDIVRPGRPFPEDRHGPGVTAEDLGAMLDTLERL
jgi:hypothetical protein